MALEAYSADRKVRAVLEQYLEGIYVYIFKDGEKYPYRDHLQNTWDIAIEQACSDYGVENSWAEIPDTCLHGEH